ncbi:uncharacterized protein (TIGR02646 family) [Pseudomonas chlororaphis]|uniref:hypothetical protein n=1 Tax=Pseudomonas chlororaphis TaxID=587753 RepID=UPI00209E8DFF|nr:hypothetical protein [Pseudomonas chlororaphis]MCP1478642.1 uncharacterized protein (TIGR02646 family) [Pseudomonas chlororaphis]MCP1595006.1 uncharacterized protein (TIGR02646 family) [Pseudomonas chlororaphis]
MIKVSKSVTPPPSLDGPDSIGGKEKQEAIKALGNGIKYKAYKGADVVAELRRIFNKKCAYCEVDYAASSPTDIEHFRPKSGYVTKDNKLSKKGYYWLASDWDNLLPSCLDCNRRRRQPIVNQKQKVMGKGNLFPVRDEASRWTDHQVASQEEPLLLNPCIDDPSLHLEFFGEGLVRAKSDKGETSIEVYGLLRGDLVEKRSISKAMVEAAIQQALALSEEVLHATNAEQQARFERLASDALKNARLHLHPSCPFLAQTRSIFMAYHLPV